MFRPLVTALTGLLFVTCTVAAPRAPSIIAPAMATALAERRLPANPLAPAAATATVVSEMELTGLMPSKIFPNLCHYHYRVSTTNQKCQEFVDQGFGFFYSYVWMESARSFETALAHDPDCAMAWWGLSKALEKWRKSKEHVQALKKAQELLSNASYRESKLITSRLQEFGLIESIKKEDRDKEAAKTLDELITLYDDDQEAWFNRALIAKKISGGTSAVPFYKALLHINPLHPGANHELVHFYETWQRPALGWPYADKYIESSPGIPHAWHMQAHLATRLGKWSKTTDRSAKAIELEQAYHEFLRVSPKQDHQYSHHLEILLVSLIHDGRFREATEIQREARKNGYKQWRGWFWLHRYRGEWKEYADLVNEYRKSSKETAAYCEALMHLDEGKPQKAEFALDVLREASEKKGKSQSKNKLYYWEAQGRFLVQTGKVDEGLDMMYKAVEETVDDFRHHAWGNGSYNMEQWGLTALSVGRFDVAEEAFLESLAHDAGSVRGALGMEVLCRKLGRESEANRFMEVARRCWRQADDGELEKLHQQIAGSVPPTAVAGPEE